MIIPITTRRRRTEPDLYFSQSVFDTTEPGIVDLRRLRGVDGKGNVCPPIAYISGLIRVSSHVFQLAEKNDLVEQQTKQTDRHTQTKNTKHKQRASHGPAFSPEVRKAIPLQPRSKAVAPLFSLWGQIACSLGCLSPCLRVCSSPSVKRFLMNLPVSQLHQPACQRVP